MRLLELPRARARSRSCRRRARSGRASCTGSTTSCCASAACQTAQVLLTFFDMSARTHYLNARQTLRKLLDWRVVPVINENDTTTTDEISFGDNDFLAAQVAVLVGADLLRAADRHRRAVTPPTRAPTAGAQLVAEVTDSAELERPRDRPRAVAARLGRDALEGRRRRDGDRGRDPGGDRAAGSARRARAGVGRRAGGHALPAAGGAPRRASSCGSSTPSRRTARLVVDAGAARALREAGTSLLPVGIVDVRGRVRRRRRGRGRATADADRQGHLQLLRRRAAARSRA